MSGARRDPVQRRSRDHVDAMLAAAVELLSSGGGLEAITTRAVAERAGVAVATVYRYFENSEAIVAALLDRDRESLDAAVAESVGALERVTLRSLIETAMFAHLRHYQRQPLLVPAWFGTSQSAIVRERMRQQSLRLSNWLTHALGSAGLLRDDAPTDGIYMVVRLTDRMIELVLRELDGTDPDEQERLLGLYADMVASYAERWATERALRGIDARELRAVLLAS